MPLTELQIEILGLLSANRNPESYVAGATPLNKAALRFSQDIDVFHDREEGVARAALCDTNALAAAGFQVSWIRQLPTVYTAEVKKDKAGTRLEWVVDSDYRFFPTMPDDTFGFVLHPVDLALNKVMAAVGRREVRDIVDLLLVHETILPLGALVWAAAEKSPGFTPEGLIAEIRRNLNYPLAEWRALATTQPIEPSDVLARLRTALADAEYFVSRMPTEKLGLLFLRDAKVVQPDPERLNDYQTHAGQRRGHWPSNPEITAAMLEHYNQPTEQETD